MKGEWFAKFNQAYGDMQKAKEALEDYRYARGGMVIDDVILPLDDAMTALAPLVEEEERVYYNRKQ